MRGLSISIMAACAAVCASASHAAPVWRGYSFGMSRDEARAVPGVSWEADREVIPDFIVVTSAAPVQVDRKLYEVSLLFSPASRLHEISFVHKIPGTPADMCRSSFEAQLAELERTYGVFSPRKAGLHETTVETRGLPGAKSFYGVLDQETIGTVAAEVVGEFVKLSAVRDMGSYKVFVDTVWSTKKPECSSIRYRLLEDQAG